jgi:hypothetical protein
MGMSMTSKSPIRVVTEAYAVGQRSFATDPPAYTPRKFTPEQLFACLVLKAFFCMDYRGICEVLRDWSDLREAIGLRSVPHYTTLQKSSRELLKLPTARRLLDSTFAGAKKKDAASQASEH